MRYQVDIGEELRKALEPIAEAEERTTTKLVRLILKRWLAERAKGGEDAQ